MSDNEFEVLDELYFVQSFAELQQQVSLPEPLLKDVLYALLQRKWIKCLQSPDNEINTDELDFETSYTQYYYLATKKGLLAHNTR